MTDGDKQEFEPTPIPGVPAVIEAQPAERPAPSRLPSLLHNRDYMLLWSGQVVSTVGSGASA
ncbi:MAG: hypothetical protein ACM3JD_15705, partial [Rudaea sp.]